MIRCLILVSVIISTVIPSAAQDLPSPRPLSMPDPLRAASLPFDLTQPPQTNDGQWTVTAGWAWFNSWSTVWELTEIHRDSGYDNTTSPTSAEFRDLEARVPTRQDNHIDIEGNLFEIHAVRGLPGGWTAGFRVPWMKIGSPNWDGFIDQWHDWFGLTDSNRSAFPRNQNLLYIQGHEGIIERRDLEGSGLGDISLFLATPPLRFVGGSHRAVAAIEAPTGDSGTLQGSGGWDLGLRLHSTWTWRRSRLHVAFGFNRLDSHGDFLGMPRSDTWSGGLGYEILLGHRWTLTGYASYEGSPLADFTNGEAGEAALWRSLALAYTLGPKWVTELQYGSNRDGMGIAPDTAFRLVIAYKP